MIEGGALIDGNGRPAVPDSVVVIRGNRITSVSRRGQASYPSNETVIKADGKFILPGLWDSQELYLSIVDRDAITHGKLIAPRWFTAIANISGRERTDLQRTGFETPLTFGLVPHFLQEALDRVKLRLDAGSDMVIFQDGALPLDCYGAAFEEIHKAGKPAFFGPPDPPYLSRME